MVRRVSLPAADQLFGRAPQSSGDEAKPVVRAVPDRAEQQERPTPTRARTSGRVKHDEKVTVYVTSGELLEIEQARLRLRAEQGLAVDRGRLVREAVALVLADLEERGDASALVRRLTEG